MDVLRNAGGVQEGAAGEFVDAAGAAALEAEDSRLVLADVAVRPDDAEACAVFGGLDADGFGAGLLGFHAFGCQIGRAARPGWRRPALTPGSSALSGAGMRSSREARARSAADSTSSATALSTSSRRSRGMPRRLSHSS